MPHGGPAILALVIFGLPANWVLIWLGLVALTVALLVLMRTSWGQSQPLRKCAVLSLLAHVLFAILAATIKIVGATEGPPAAQPTIWVTIATSPEQNSDEDATTAAARPDETLWESPEGAAELPDAALAQASRPEPSPLEPAQHPEPPPIEPLLRPEHKPELPQPDSAHLVQQTSPQRPVAQPPAEPIETIVAQRQEAPPVAQPEPQLSRRQFPEVEPPPSPRPDEAQQDASSAFDQLTPLVRVPRRDALPVTESASALPPDLLSRQATAAPAAPAPRLADDRANQHEPTAGADAGHQQAASGSPPITATAAQPTQDTLSESQAHAGSPGGAQPAPGPHELPSLYKLRAERNRDEILRQAGGGPATEAAVQAALTWLANNQSADGSWSAVVHGGGYEHKVLGHDRLGAGINADTAITGLAVLTFLGAGQTHQTGHYTRQVGRGLDYLIGQQARDGNLAGRAGLFARMYCHGMANFALGEAYAMTHDAGLRGPLQKAIAYTVAAQARSSGGWRYRPGDPGDTSQLGWQLMSLKSASLGGITVPDETTLRAGRFLLGVRSGQQGGLAGYRPQHAPSRAMTAEAMFCRQLLNEPIRPQTLNEASAYLLGELPGRGQANFYYWYYATLMLYQMQGPAWERWNEALKDTLVGSQRNDGALAGSWDPTSVWGGYGGRVYSTSLGALCLEVYYRYLPLYVETARRGQPPGR